MADSSRAPSHRLPHFFGGIPPLRAGLRDGLARLDSIALDVAPESPKHTTTRMQKFASILKRLGRCQMLGRLLEPDGGNVGGIVSVRNIDQQAAIASTPLLKAAKDANMAAFQRALREICTLRGESEEMAVVETRGAEGETAAHLCMLFHTKRHVDMATKLFRRYGKPLINAAYRGDSYKGETALHMAIEKRNVELVRMLCDMGADLHARATGTFFKKRKVGGDDTYFGEFPLSFAIATGQHEVAAILLEKGANPYEQDCYGNTALHIAVLKKQPAMYSFLRAWVDISETDMGCETEDEAVGSPSTGRRLQVTAVGSNVRISDPELGHEVDNEEILSCSFSASVRHPHPSPFPLAQTHTHSSNPTPLSPPHASEAEGERQQPPQQPSDRPIPLWEVPNGRKLPGKQKRAKGLTPLEYAARIGDSNVFDHIFRQEREELWRYWTVKSTVIDVESLERCLDVAIMHRSWDLLMLPTIYQALHWKWKRFARKAFVWSTLRYLTYLTLCFTTATFCGDRVFGPRSYICPSWISQRVGFVAELATSLFAVTYLLHDMYEAEELRAFKSFNSFFRFIEGPDVLKLSRWIHSLLVMGTVIARQTKHIMLAHCLLAVAMLCGWVRLLYTCAIFPLTGTLVSVIVEILFRDVGRFLIIYCILLWAFSQSMLILFLFNHKPSRYPDLAPTPGYDGSLRALGSLFQLTIVNYEWDELGASPLSGLVYALFILFVVLVIVLLLNLLIARMNTTYTTVVLKAEKTFRSQWARFIVHRQKRMSWRTQQRVALPGRQPPAGERRKWYITETITEEEVHSADANMNATSRKEKAYNAWSLARIQVTNALKQRGMHRMWMDDKPYTSARSLGHDSGITSQLSRARSHAEADCDAEFSNPE